MKLKVLGSSSNGNCYILDNGKEALIIEAGVKLGEVRKALEFKTLRIVGCIVTHEHADHAKYVENYLKAYILTYMSEGTASALKLEIPTTLFEKEQIMLGGFSITPYRVVHNAEEPFCYIIQHDEIGTMLFATDCRDIPYYFKGLTNIMMECNHSLKIIHENITNGTISEELAIKSARNHMSYGGCCKYLAETDLSVMNNIVLIHLSDANSNANEFQEGIKNLTGKNVFVAENGMEIEFNKTPF